MTSAIEQEYQARMDALTPLQRIERCAAMFQWMREMIGRQIVKEQGPLTDERLKWEVARRIYGAEPTIVAMIDKRLADVSG